MSTFAIFWLSIAALNIAITALRWHLHGNDNRPAWYELAIADVAILFAAIAATEVNRV